MSAPSHPMEVDSPARNTGAVGSTLSSPMLTTPRHNFSADGARSPAAAVRPTHVAATAEDGRVAMSTSQASDAPQLFSCKLDSVEVLLAMLLSLQLDKDQVRWRLLSLLQLRICFGLFVGAVFFRADSLVSRKLCAQSPATA